MLSLVLAAIFVAGIHLGVAGTTIRDRAIASRRVDLWGRKLADVAWAVYGAHASRAAKGALTAPAELTAHPLIGGMEDAAGINAAEWLASAGPGSEIIYRTSSLINQLNAAKKASASRSSHATWVIASRS